MTLEEPSPHLLVSQGFIKKYAPSPNKHETYSISQFSYNVQI